MIVTAKSRLVVKFPNFEKEDDLVSWCPYSLIGDSDHSVMLGNNRDQWVKMGK